MRHLLFAIAALLVTATPAAAQEEGDRHFADLDPLLEREDGEEMDEDEEGEGGLTTAFTSLSFDLSLDFDGASNDVAARHADALFAGVGLQMRGRFGQQFSGVFAGFLEGGLGVKLGVMEASLEDARPLFHEDSFSGLGYGASIEVGAGFAFGPFSLSGGFTADTIGGLLEGDPGVYTDLDNNGIYEREDITVDFGSWGAYVEASFTEGPPASLGGSGLFFRFYPSYYFNFREGEIRTQAYVGRAQTDLGLLADITDNLLDVNTHLFVEFGILENKNKLTPDTFWLKLGLTINLDG